MSWLFVLLLALVYVYDVAFFHMPKRAHLHSSDATLSVCTLIVFCFYLRRTFPLGIENRKTSATHRLKYNKYMQYTLLSSYAFCAVVKCLAGVLRWVWLEVSGVCLVVLLLIYRTASSWSRYNGNYLDSSCDALVIIHLPPGHRPQPVVNSPIYVFDISSTV